MLLAGRGGHFSSPGQQETSLSVSPGEDVTKEWFHLARSPSSFPGGSDGEKSAHNAGDPASIPGSGRSPGEGWLPTPVFLPGESHRQRSLAGCSPWGRKESDTTEQLNSSNSIKLRGPCIRAQFIAKAEDVYWSFQFSIQHRNRLCVNRIASL